MRRKRSYGSGQAFIQVELWCKDGGDQKPPAHCQESYTFNEETRRATRHGQRWRADIDFVAGSRARPDPAAIPWRLSSGVGQCHLLPPRRELVAHERAIRAEEEIRRDFRGSKIHQSD